MYIPNVNSILAAGLALTGGSGLMKKRTFFSVLLPPSLPPLPLLLFLLLPLPDAFLVFPLLSLPLLWCVWAGGITGRARLWVDEPVTMDLGVVDGYS